MIYDNIQPLSETAKMDLVWLVDFLCAPAIEEDMRNWIDYFIRNSDPASEDNTDD